MLVQCGMFEEVLLSFLPVGHTHEDIDALFSQLHAGLRRVDVFSRQEVEPVFKTCCRRRGETHQYFRLWDSVPNISDHLAAYVPPLQGIMAFRQIRLRRPEGARPDSVVVAAQFREFASGPEEEWAGLSPDASYDVVLKAKVDLSNIPCCQRSMCTPPYVLTRLLYMQEMGTP